MVTCSRRLTFEAGHRVLGHEGKCAHAHGHSYKVVVTAEAPELDGVGRVVDFSVLKDRIGGWIDRYWDHSFIAFESDAGMIEALSAAGSRHFVMRTNPTAENLADFLLRQVCTAALAGTPVTVRSVVVWETENCYAEARL